MGASPSQWLTVPSLSDGNQVTVTVLETELPQLQLWPKIRLWVQQRDNCMKSKACGIQEDGLN